MPDVFDEISEDLRHEKLKLFWKENGSWIIGAAIGAVLLTAVLTVWRQWEYRRNTAATAELTRVVASADLPQLKSFAEAGPENHAMMARFAAASLHLERGEKDQAIALYDAIAGTSGIDRTWRDLAGIFSIGQRLDKGDPEKLKKELAAIAGGKSPWRINALELQALLAARTGQAQQAAEILIGIAADSGVPDDARTRALALRALYLAEASSAPASGEK